MDSLLTSDVTNVSNFFFSSRRRHTRSLCDWSSDVCSSDLVADDRANAGRQPLGSAPAVRDHDLVAVAEERADQVDADELRASDHQHTHLRPHTDRTVLEDPATTTPRQRPRYSATARQVVVRVTPSIAPISSVTRRPTASSVGPSTTAMKSNGPVTASRLTTLDTPPLIWVSSFFTDLVLPAAVSMSTYARMPFPVFVMAASLSACSSRARPRASPRTTRCAPPTSSPRRPLACPARPCGWSDRSARRGACWPARS